MAIAFEEGFAVRNCMWRSMITAMRPPWRGLLKHQTWPGAQSRPDLPPKPVTDLHFHGLHMTHDTSRALAHQRNGGRELPWHADPTI